MSQIKLTADSGGGTTSLKAPSSTTSNADVVLKLPVADGSSGQVLKTDGSGQLSFTSNAGTTINNNDDNKIITGSGTANNLNAESNAIIDNSGRLKLGNIDNSETITNAPLYLEVQTDITAVNTNEGGGSTGLFRMTDDGTNTDRYHGIELRNRSTGDIRILNHDRNNNDKGDLVIGMPTSGSGSIQEKLRFSSIYDAIQIAGKGGATINSSLGEDLQKTDIYITTKTSMTSPTMNAGSELAGIIRFHETGSNDNRYHGLELRNRRSGDVRFLNADRGVDNKGDAVIVCDSGSGGLFENARFLNTGGIAFNGDTAAANGLNDYEFGSWTPTITDGGGSGTVSYTTQQGRYVKIGRSVFLTCQLVFTVSGANGYLQVAGIPFNCSGNTGSEYIGTAQYNSRTVAISDDIINIVSIIQQNNSYVHFRGFKHSTNAYDTIGTAGHSWFRLSLFYETGS